MAAIKAVWIGLGVMGFPMAGHLSQLPDASVTVFNRNPAKARHWLELYKGQSAPTPREAVADADFVFSCVGNDDDLRQVTVGDEGVFQAMKTGALYIDHTTTSALVAQELAQQAGKQGLGFLDAPVSGGQAGAQQGKLTVMCGGALDHFKAAEPVIAAYARMCKLLGPVGAGQTAKMCNQIAIAGVLAGLSESLHFAMTAGLDVEPLVEVISKGAAGSWQMENRSGTMAEGKFDFGFAVDWMRKDLSICLDAARRNGARLPTTALVDQFYADVQAMGGGSWDTSSLITRLQPQAVK